MKLCLGTVQFGLNYGLLGQKKPSLDDAVHCLDYATQNGISSIDTAEAYGTAQEVVGAFLEKKTVSRDGLFISSKFLPNALDNCKPENYAEVILRHLKASLQMLHTDYLDAYLFHSARYIFNDEMLRALALLKDEGLVRRTGVSVYEPEEAFTGLKSRFVDFMQMPYSIFDHRMKRSGVFDFANNSNCELHTRSAFIQGLILMDEEQVPAYLTDAKPIISRIKKISLDTGISRVSLAIAYVKQEQSVSHLVFGVDSLTQLIEDIALFQQNVPPDILSEMERSFAEVKTEIIMPSLWKK